MSLRILYNNVWRNGSITAKSAEQAQFPAVDTQGDTKLMFWRTPANNDSNETIDNDLASNKSISSIVLWNHDFSANANISIIGADDANFANNAHTTAVTYNAGNLAFFFTPDELVVNGGFANNTANWTAVDCTLASIGEGQSGNCCEVTRTGANYQSMYQVITGLIVGANYDYSAYVKSATSDLPFVIMALAGANELDSVNGISSQEWIKYSGSFTATNTTETILCKRDSASVGKLLFDTVTCKPTDPSISRRYWRLRIQDANNALNYIQCGPVFLGPYWQPSRYFKSDYEDGAEDMSGIDFTDSGQIIADEKPMPEVKRYQFEGLTDADQVEIKALIKAVGVHVPFVLCLDSDYPNTYSYYVRLAEITQPIFKHMNCWNWEMAVREAF
jgi:hypothetical protein